MKIALIGYGNIARKHLEVFRALQCDVVASCNRSERGNQLARTEGQIPRTYFNYCEMVERESPDAIINCVPFDKIYEVTRELIPYKIPLLVEKPAGTSMEELKDLIKLQQYYKTIVQVAFNRRHYSVFEKALYDMGGPQALQLVNLEWSENPHRLRTSKGYSDEQLGKILFGNTIHGLDLISWISGSIEDSNVFVRKQADYLWSMVLGGLSKKGVVVGFTSTWGNAVPWRLVMHSINKRYEFAPLETCRVYTDGNSSPTDLFPDEIDKIYKAGFYNQAVSFIRAIESNSCKHDLLSCINSMTLAENFYLSFEKRNLRNFNNY